MTKGPDFRPRPSPTGGRNWIWTSGPLRVNPSPFVLLRPRPTQNVMVDAIRQRPGTLRHVIDRNRDGSMFVLRLLLCFQGAPYTSSPPGHGWSDSCRPPPSRGLAPARGEGITPVRRLGRPGVSAGAES